MVDMGDDGEIADVSEVCHARGYDLVLGFGQGGLMSKEVSQTWGSARPKWAELESEQALTLAKRMFLRLVPYVFPRTPVNFNAFGNSHFLQTLRASLLAVCRNTHNDRALGITLAGNLLFLHSFAAPKMSGVQINPAWLTTQALEALGSPRLHMGSRDGQTADPKDVFEILGEVLDHYEDAPTDISTSRDEVFSTLAENLGRDRNASAAGKNLWNLSLFEYSALNKDCAQAWEAFRDFCFLNTDWEFWRDWYQGFLDGNPLDWGLQRRVALIDDATWARGPEAVAAEIERIRSRYELEQEIANLKEQLTAVQNTPAAALIGDNGGPPLEDAPARAFQTDLALIWKQIEELEEEIAKPSPSPSLLEKIAKALWEISLRMAAYCGSVADGMIREGTKELAKAGAKWTARATAVTVTAQTEGVQSVVKAIGAFVKTLQ
ncbi:hypothetical protein K4K94_11500 [Phaeobacter inhibens]|uniref:hypothetical protein n=1 Tax=Phaeobacter inhibens TaxID=221822 RepID=UPI0021A7D13C|nr:hypothetical protein [Phaeobacter inhibens]UWS02941.1 hypothetical protein K4K94_11500 [Phaeobacter inhibens]